MPPIQTVTGAQIPLDAAYIANLGAQNNLTARGQDIQTRGQDIGMITAMAAFEQQGQQALQEYYNNVAQFGLDKARGIYEQRLATAQIGLQAAAAGGQQRTDRASLKLQALQMLADRRGPQNAFGYDYLLDKMGTPTGQAVDPTTFADDIVDPRFEQGANHNWAGNLGDESLFNGLQGPQMAAGLGQRPSSLAGLANVQNVSPWSYTLQRPPASLPAGAAAPAGGGAGPGPIMGAGTHQSPGISTPGNITGLQPDEIFSGVRNQDVAGMKSGEWKFITTGTGGKSKVSDYTGHEVYRDPSTKYDPNAEIDAGIPIWLKALSEGGQGVTDPMSIVGEGATAEDLGSNGELLINPTGAPFDIVNNKDAKALLKAIAGGKKAEAKSGDVTLGRERKGGMPSHSKGTFLEKLNSYGEGTYGGPGVSMNIGTPHPDRPDMVWNGSGYVYRGHHLAQIQQPGDDAAVVAARKPGTIAGGADEQRAVEAAVVDRLIQNILRSTPGATSNYKHENGNLYVQLQDGSWSGFETGEFAGQVAGRQFSGSGMSGGLPWFDPGAGRRSAQGGGGGYRGTDPAMVQDFGANPVFKTSAGVASQGGDGSQTTVLNPDGSYGMPENDLHIKYSPDVIANAPFMKALKTGQRPGGTFGGFGAPISNPKQGIFDLPSNINLQGFRDMDTSQQKLTQSAYEQGAAMDFRDIFDKARKAAPAGVSTGRKRYGG